MLLWVTFAIMTATALGALLWPVYRHGAAEPGLVAGYRDAEVAVYRDQLSEIDRDVARGLIDAEEAQAARNEVSRRLLAAADPQIATGTRSSPGARRAALFSSLVAIPVIALSTYLASGRPDLPGLPHSQRMATALERSDIDAMVATVEAHLADNPRDAQGWLVLATSYRGMGRYEEAAEAFTRALELSPRSADLLADFGEALVLAKQGLLTPKAREAFDEGLSLDPRHRKALYYRALADRQDGRHETALATWRSMLEDAPADAPWRPAVERQIASLGRERSGMPLLGDADIAKAEELGDEERQAIVRGMVDGLSRRLESQGGDLQGWLRLARARAVLGEQDAAVAALRTAEHHFSGDADALEQIAETRDALGLDPSGDKESP